MDQIVAYLLVLFCVVLGVTCFDIGQCVIDNQCRDCDCVNKCRDAGLKFCKDTYCKDNDPNCEDDVKCSNAMRNSANRLCDCLENEGDPCCNTPDQALGRTQIDCLFPARLLQGANLVREGEDCIPGCQIPNCPASCTIDVPQLSKRKKRQALQSIFIDFNPNFIFHQDNIPTKLITKDKKRKCCVTTKRVVPFTWKIKKDIWPVFCPLSGGFQWIDQVLCNIKRGNNNSNLRKYQILGPSKGKKCKHVCVKECTMRTYLVTNLVPQGFWGHCFYFFTPVWFRNVKVDTHCICPKFPPNDPKQKSTCY